MQYLRIRRRPKTAIRAAPRRLQAKKPWEREWVAQKKSFDVMHVRACALFLSLSINNSRGRCVFYGSNGLNDGTTKTSHRETMVTFQACPDCPGVANETVPFLVPCPCLRPGQISRDCTIILGLKLATSNNDSACSQRFFFNSQVLNPGLIQPVLCADICIV